ncbi:heavy metal translocating P-type ATPase [Legionella londiniensis]|uniref:Cation transporting ATPase PacS n=1 Tax=Legionella londiniensis TaxID=45068 RepID=A0A0W0VN43_9GAMM|nr:cation-translocating P-type ATPase [Legionella londiniensis]KTD21341.1 cation transporting ATPase PacS [Legionella londiniensis]STX93603.1 cation transporting ATPase PacS [Legionella londiniensis]
MAANIYYFSLPDIKCMGCVGAIESKLNQKKSELQIDSFAIDLLTKKLTIIVRKDARGSKEQFTGTICSLFQNYNCVEMNTEVSETFWQKLAHYRWLLGLIGTLGGAGLLILSLFAGGLPLGVMIALGAASTLLTLLLGAEFYWQAAKKLLKEQTLTMDTLFAVSTITVLAVSISAFFFPALPMMFEAGLLIFGFRHIGIAIEESIKNSAGFRSSFKDRLPQTVTKVLSNSETEKKPLSAIQVNEVILINPGELVPLDGYSETEESVIYDTIATGSILPRVVKKGEKLLAGMRLADDAFPLCLKVSATTEESYLAQLDEHIARAHTEKAPLETFTDKALQYFIPAVLIIALTSAIALSFFFPPLVAIQFATAVLVSACPCTLGFIIPLAVKIGTNKALEHGVQFKNGKTLQDAEQINCVVFDLNGTLTEGIPRVSSYKALAGSKMSSKEMLTYLGLLEQESTHPVGQAIKQFASKNSLSSSEFRVTNRQARNTGVQAVISNVQYSVGSQTMMQQLGIEIPVLEVKPQCGESVIYLAREKEIVGFLVMSDPLRHQARHAVDSLKKLGKKVYICTGADEATARRYGWELGIDANHIFAQCNGSDSGEKSKNAFIKKLQQGGDKVAMIGDAGNDALAIAASDFGIAVKSKFGDGVTQENAGAIVQSGSLTPIVSAFAVAKQTVNNIKQNLILSLGYNLLALMLGVAVVAIGFSIHPALGVVLMITQSSLILLNAYRFKQQVLEHLEAPAKERPLAISDSHRQVQDMLPNNEKSMVLEETIGNEESRDQYSASISHQQNINTGEGLQNTGFPNLV